MYLISYSENYHACLRESASVPQDIAGGPIVFQTLFERSAPALHDELVEKEISY